MTGGKGDDDMEGGSGNDTMYGNDTLYGDGHDVIMDFEAGRDRLLLNGVESPDDIDVGQAGGSTFIAYGETRIELRDAELTGDQVWKLVDSE